MKRNLIIFVVALPFLISFAFLIATKRPAPVPDLPLPNPNGYDKFVAAAEIRQEDAEGYDTMTESELAALVATNAEALELVQSAFTNECRVPIQYTSSYFSTDIKYLMGFRMLAQVMTAKGRLAELQKHSAEAAQDYLDVIHFGTESGRGGFITDAMIGIAIEQMAQSQLTNLVDNLDSASCRATALTLESLDSHRQNWDDVLDKETPLGYRLAPGLKTYITIWLHTHNEVSEIKKKSRKLFHETQAQSRNLAVQFAARAYELDKGKPPTSITNLVPTYLKAVPQDPTTGKDMVYPP